MTFTPIEDIVDSNTLLQPFPENGEKDVFLHHKTKTHGTVHTKTKCKIRSRKWYVSGNYRVKQTRKVSI